MSVITSQNKVTTTEWALSCLDYIPVVSMIANIAHMILRSLCKFDAKVSDYGKFLQLRDFSGHAVRSIPVINLIASAILDSRRKESGLTTFAFANDETKALEAISSKDALHPDEYKKIAGHFAFISDDLKNSPEFAFKAVVENPYVYTYLPACVKTEELLLKALKENPEAFSQFPKDKQNNSEFALKCLKENYKVADLMSHKVLDKPELSEYLKEKLKNVPIEEIEEIVSCRLIKWVDPDRVLEAISNGLISKSLISRCWPFIEDKEFMLKVIDNNPEIFVYLQGHSTVSLLRDVDFIKECIKRNLSICSYLSRYTIANKEIQSCIRDAFNEKKEDKALLAEIVCKNIELFFFLPEELMSDSAFNFLNSENFVSLRKKIIQQMLNRGW